MKTATHSNLTVETAKLLTKAHPDLNQQRTRVLLALIELTGNDVKKAMGILTSELNLVTNIETATNWEEIRLSTLSFADQVASSFDDDETWLLAEKRVKELTELKPEDAEAYFTDSNEYGFYLFPELEIAFCLRAEHVKLLQLPYPARYELAEFA